MCKLFYNFIVIFRRKWEDSSQTQVTYSKLFSSDKKEARKFKFGKSFGLCSYKIYIFRLQQINIKSKSQFSEHLTEREFRKRELQEGELKERLLYEQGSSSEQLIWQYSEEFEKEFRTIREIIEELRVE
jgi:hypothetical protein